MARSNQNYKAFSMSDLPPYMHVWVHVYIGCVILGMLWGYFYSAYWSYPSIRNQMKRKMTPRCCMEDNTEDYEEEEDASKEIDFEREAAFQSLSGV